MLSNQQVEGIAYHLFIITAIWSKPAKWISGACVLMAVDLKPKYVNGNVKYRAMYC